MGFFDFLTGGGDDDKPESPFKFQTIPQTEEAKEARKRLYELATGEPPPVPRQKIAPLPPVTEERKIARETAKELIQPQDIFALPEVQGIIQEARVTGDLLANRLSRMLQSAGSLTATSGRDVLGRAVTDVQKSLASSLAPFAMEERGRRTSLIPVLESLGLTEELRKQGFSQAELDALFQQEFTESRQLETFTIPLLRSVMGDQPGIIPFLPTEGTSALSSMSPIIGQILSSVLGNKGGGAGVGSLVGGAGKLVGGAASSAIGGIGGLASGAAGGIGSLLALLSDERFKENIKPIEGALEKVKSLEGKTYNFKTQNIRSAGILAQDLEEVLPEAVVEHKGVKYIRVDGVLALLINAVNELAGKVN